jgi:hypothetical protein
MVRLPFFHSYFLSFPILSLFILSLFHSLVPKPLVVSERPPLLGS